MNAPSRHIVVSVLLLTVCFLALVPLSPATTRSRTWSSRNPTYTYAHTGHSGWTRSRTWSNTWSRTWSRSWSNTWSRTWSNTWHASWTRTWSRRTQIYPTYTKTEYAPYPPPFQGCDPNDPYCGYYPGYVPPQAPYPWCYPNNPYCSVYPPTQTVTTMVTQPANPDFYLSAWPSTVSLPPNEFVGSANFVLIVTSLGGWSGQLQFTTSALPQGITLSNLPPSTYQLNSLTAGWNIQVTIDANARTGSYPLVITGVNGSLTSSVVVTINVSNANQ